MNSLKALRSICYECEKNMAINKTRCPFRSISNEFCKEYNLIKKDLEVLEIFKNNISVKTETWKMGNVFLKNESIAYNNHDLIIKNEEEFNKIKNWIIK